jgi:hypothetical protein
VVAVTTRTASRRRWPLLAIGASAGTATWSGWVGLGELTGFGVVHPLPGIWDDLTINTAVTLPIGVEAYAMYALSIATSPRPLAARVRRYAWASSAAALALGMAGQVAYHVMTSRGGRDPAPWWVTALVSCLPVLVLGAASLLWHLAGHDDPIEPPDLPDPIRSTATDSISRPMVDPPADDAPRPMRAIATGAQPPRVLAAVRSGVPVVARAADLDRTRAAIRDGELPPRPTAAAIRAHLAISPAYARAARDAIRADTVPTNPTDHPEQESEQLLIPEVTNPSSSDTDPAPEVETQQE